MIDNGLVDEKIIAVSPNDPFYSVYKDIFELPEHISQEIRHFFQVYKTLEGKTTVVHQMQNREAALAIIAQSRQTYEDKFGAKHVAPREE